MVLAGQKSLSNYFELPGTRLLAHVGEAIFYAGRLRMTDSTFKHLAKRSILGSNTVCRAPCYSSAFFSFLSLYYHYVREQYTVISTN